MENLVAELTSAIDGHVAHTVSTTARIGGGSPGKLIAVSTFESRNWLTGFKASVGVALLDVNNQVLAVTDKIDGWADGMWIGQSRMSKTWTHQFDPEVTNGVAKLVVYHTSRPPDWIIIFKRIAELVKIIIDAINSANSTSGVTNIPNKPVYERDGESLVISSERSAPWSEVGLPWSENVNVPAPPPIRTCRANISPSTIVLGEPTTITVTATDEATNQPVTGQVLLGNSIIGMAGTPISVTIIQRYTRKVNPRTQEVELIPVPPPRLSFQADGYRTVYLEYTLSGGELDLAA